MRSPSIPLMENSPPDTRGAECCDHKPRWRADASPVRAAPNAGRGRVDHCGSASRVPHGNIGCADRARPDSANEPTRYRGRFLLRRLGSVQRGARTAIRSGRWHDDHALGPRPGRCGAHGDRAGRPPLLRTSGGAGARGSRQRRDPARSEPVPHAHSRRPPAGTCLRCKARRLSPPRRCCPDWPSL